MNWTEIICTVMWCLTLVYISRVKVRVSTQTDVEVNHDEDIS
jgi:hypothetical protein